MGIVYALPNEVMPGLVKASPMTPIPVPRPCTVLPIHPRQPQLRMRGRQARIEPLQPPRSCHGIERYAVRLQHHATGALIARESGSMIVEIPDPACTADPTFAARFRATRPALCRAPKRGQAMFTGVGFWDFIHNQRGRAKNGFELPPVLAIKPL